MKLGKLDDISVRGHQISSCVIEGDKQPSPPPFDEDLFSNSPKAEKHYMCLSTLGLVYQNLHSHWVSGAHQKIILFT